MTSPTTTSPPTWRDDYERLLEVRRLIRDYPRNPSGSLTWAAMDDYTTDMLTEGLLELRLERAQERAPDQANGG